MASSSLAARASGRGRPQGVDPLAAQVSWIFGDVMPSFSPYLRSYLKFILPCGVVVFTALKLPTKFVMLVNFVIQIMHNLTGIRRRYTSATFHTSRPGVISVFPK